MRIGAGMLKLLQMTKWDFFQTQCSIIWNWSIFSSSNLSLL